MPNVKKKLSSFKLPISAISQKLRSHAGDVKGGLGTAPTSRKTPDAAKVVIGQFSACECAQALLAGYFLTMCVMSQTPESR